MTLSPLHEIGLILVLGAMLLGPVLGVPQPIPRGALIVGAGRLGRSLAITLHDAGIPVVLVDRSWRRLKSARMAGIRTYFGSVLSDEAHDAIDYEGLGCLLALSSSDEVNSLAGLHLAELFGRNRVFQLPPDESDRKTGTHTSRELHAHYLFGPDADYHELLERLREGYSLKLTRLTPEFSFEEFLTTHGERALPLLLVRDDGPLGVFTEEASPAPMAGDTVVALIPPDSGASTDSRPPPRPSRRERREDREDREEAEE